MKVLKCKKTNKEFKDIENRSGSITNHLKELNIEVPSSFIRRKYLKKENKQWHLQFFDEIKIEDIIKKQCKYCTWETVDIENKSGMYTSHLYKEHGITIEGYIQEYPEESNLFKTFFYKKRHKENIFKEGNHIICQICGEKLKKITNTHTKKHNMSLQQYREKFIYTLSDKSFETFSNNMRKTNLSLIKSFKSKAEFKIKELLEKEGLKLLHGDKKFLNGIEIDLICHEKKIGIEYNGCRYHTEIFGKKDRSFHLEKTKSMNKKGYGLIHIFEDEWELNQQKVINKLYHIFNISNKSKIFARKCEIKPIGLTQKNTFLNDNHIQGEDNSNIFLGAFFEDKLVSVMTFDNTRSMNVKNNKDTIFELKRFATDINFSVVGIGGKLLKYFIKNYNPEKILSFADLRWTINTSDNLYTKLGFKLEKTLAPDYTYINHKIHRIKRQHKFGFGKSSIKRKFPHVYNPNKTEWEMMQQLGYDRIWDCGKLRFELIC